MTNSNEKTLENIKSQNEFERPDNLAKNFNILDYMKWVESFTKRNRVFYSDDEYNCADPDEGVTKDDLTHIKNLTILYEIVKKYSEECFIFPVLLSYGEFYYIKYNYNVYEIGMPIGTENVYSCELKKTPITKNVILIEDILNPQKETLVRIENIKTELQVLEDLTYELIIKGIPYEAIRSGVNKVISEHQNKKNSIKEI